MKKRIILLLVFFMCSSAFSNMMFEWEVSGLGNITRYRHDEIYKYVGKEVTRYNVSLGIMSSSVLYEFRSNQPNKIHLYTGGQLGLFDSFNFSGIFGANFEIAEFGRTRIEFDVSSKQGVALGIYGEVSLFMENSLMFNMMSRSRRGFYWGTGITDSFNLQNLELYVDYGTRLVFENFFGITAMVGFRL